MSYNIRSNRPSVQTYNEPLPPLPSDANGTTTSVAAAAPVIDRLVEQLTLNASGYEAQDDGAQFSVAPMLSSSPVNTALLDERARRLESEAAPVVTVDELYRGDSAADFESDLPGSDTIEASDRRIRARTTTSDKPLTPRTAAAIGVDYAYEKGDEADEESGPSDLVWQDAKDGGSVRVIKGGTLERLVERLTYADYVDATYLLDFLLTFRSFTTPSELLSILRQRWHVQPPPEVRDNVAEWEKTVRHRIRLRVFNVLKNWVTRVGNDFVAEPSMAQEAIAFAHEMGADMPNATSTNKLIELLQRKLSGTETEKQLVFTEPPPKSLVPLGRPTTYHYRDVPPQELARQATLIEHEAWTKADKEERAPNVLAMIGRFNQMSGWVAQEILTGTDAHARKKLIHFFIDFADECMKLNNFNGAIEILAGIDNSAIYRLKQTWPLVSDKRKKTYTRLKAIMSSSQSYKAMRDALHKCKPPCVPYLGMFLTDLTFVEDGNKDYIEHHGKRLISFQKARLLASVVKEIQIYQQTPYCLQPIPYIQSSLLSVKPPSANELYEKSLVVEPRGSAAEAPPPSLKRTGTLRGLLSRSKKKSLGVERQTVTVRIRLPAAKSAKAYDWDPDLPWCDAKLFVYNDLDADMRRLHNLNAFKLMVPPTRSSPGEIIDDLDVSVVVGSLLERDGGTIGAEMNTSGGGGGGGGGEQDEIIFEFVPDPIGVVLVDYAHNNLSTAPARIVLLSCSLPLVKIVPTLRRALFGGRSEELLFMHLEEGEEMGAWIRPTLSLKQHQLLSDNGKEMRGRLSVFPTTVYMQREPSSFRAEKEGWLTKVSEKQGALMKSMTAKQQRWFLLVDNMLVYYKARDDSEPCGCLALDYHQLEVSNEYEIVLRRHREAFDNTRTLGMHLTGEVEEIASWHHFLTKHEVVNRIECTALRPKWEVEDEREDVRARVTKLHRLSRQSANSDASARGSKQSPRGAITIEQPEMRTSMTESFSEPPRRAPPPSRNTGTSSRGAASPRSAQQLLRAVSTDRLARDVREQHERAKELRASVEKLDALDNAPSRPPPQLGHAATRLQGVMRGGTMNRGAARGGAGGRGTRGFAPRPRGAPPARASFPVRPQEPPKKPPRKPPPLSSRRTPSATSVVAASSAAAPQRRGSKPVCPVCSEVCRVGSKFCTECGHRLQ